MMLYIKNMVCQRCELVVKAELEKLHLHPVNISLGEVLIEEKELNKQEIINLSNALIKVGFELLDDKKSRIIERVKNFIINQVHYKDEKPQIKFSELLSQHLKNDYSYLSNLFSEVEGITIEQYYIRQKIEKVKEMIIYDELTLSEIASKLGYSSVSYLSNQFKKITGYTPTHFKQIGKKKRKFIDKI